ncbi:hypothetical protein [Horticoccus sp. 23ND18S-11]
MIGANGRSFIDAYEDPVRKVDPSMLLRAAKVRLLSDEDKARYIVIKFSYVLFDPVKNAVALIDRVGGRHKQSVGKHSLLLSSGMDGFYGALELGGENFFNSYYPFTRKLGALVNEFALPFVSYKEFSHPVRHFAFVVRKLNERYYAFFIHLAVLMKGGRFPRTEFSLDYPNPDPELPRDLIQGFFGLDEAERLLKDSNFLVDRYALSILRGEDFSADGLEGVRFTPRFAWSKLGGRVWDSVLLRPSWHGLGIDLKKLVE